MRCHVTCGSGSRNVRNIVQPWSSVTCERPRHVSPLNGTERTGYLSVTGDRCMLPTRLIGGIVAAAFVVAAGMPATTRAANPLRVGMELS